MPPNRLSSPASDGAAYLRAAPEAMSAANWQLKPSVPLSGAGWPIASAGSADRQDAPRKVRFALDSLLEGAGFEPSVPRQAVRRAAVLSLPPSPTGRSFRRGGYGPGGDRRPDRAVEIADRRWCASEPPPESRIKPSRRVGPSRGTDGSNPSPSSGELIANLTSCAFVENQGFRAVCSPPEPRRHASRKRRRRGFQQIASSHTGFCPSVPTARPISLNSVAQCSEQGQQYFPFPFRIRPADTRPTA